MDESRVAAWLRRPLRRRQADQLLRASEGRWETHRAVAWRVAELTSPRARRIDASALRAIVREARDPRPSFSRSVLARRRLRGHVHELELLADRVADLDLPTTGAGIVSLRDLLTNAGSPLYADDHGGALGLAIEHIHDLLEAA